MDNEPKLSLSKEQMEANARRYAAEHGPAAFEPGEFAVEDTPAQNPDDSIEFTGGNSFAEASKAREASDPWDQALNPEDRKFHAKEDKKEAA